MFYFIANNLSLDLVNTLIVDGGAEKDLLEDFRSLIDWAAEARIIGRTTAEKMFRDRNGTPVAEKALEEALEFRSNLKEMTKALANGKSVGRAAIEAINERLANRHGHSELRRVGDGYEKHFVAEFRDPSDLLVPIAESAADLLCYADPNLVHKCENDKCVLHFYDTSKNHRRRWCSMSACGNRAKASAFYKRRSGAK